MRIWSLHPSYLDRQGLLACWRETLLAQAVLAGKTRGYRNHSQLLRFRQEQEPVRVIGSYLSGVAAEAADRGYSFNAALILDPSGDVEPMDVSIGQLDYEWSHLSTKLEVRDPERLATFASINQPRAHPLFVVSPGPVADWERTS